MLGIGVILQTGAYILRWIEIVRLGLDQTPLSVFTLYESLVFTAWALVLLYLLFDALYHVPLLGAGCALCAGLVVLCASLSGTIDPAIKELPSVLRGNLFVPHAISSMAAFAAFILSVICSAAILLPTWFNRLLEQEECRSGCLPDVQVLDKVNYKTLVIGFFLYTLGMATGAYRCKIIWGRYWSWDPSEVSSVLVWTVYAFILHGRYQNWWRPRATALFAIIAFVFACLCFVISARFLLASRHYPIT